MEASFYTKRDKNAVLCHLCRQRCLIEDGARGLCGVRENREGILYSLVYGKPVARHVDPIEKKPLFHLAPGSLTYSLATVGCNFTCRFCQNADIAQMPKGSKGTIIGENVDPETAVSEALSAGCRSMAFTYTEPTIFFEYARDTAMVARGKGLLTLFVSNGYLGSEAILAIAPYLDAANIDLKAFTDDFYKTYCGARLEPVKQTLREMKAAGIFLEITTLLIPGLNDNETELRALAEFIASDLGPETPWHISRFHPTYQLTDRPVTPRSSLAFARNIGVESGLYYVYTGNVPGDVFENTFCHSCGRTLITRQGYRIIDYALDNGVCPDCRTPLHGVEI